MLPFKTILHPTDFSADSMYAFHLACSLAGYYQAKLILLHVMMPSPVPFGEPSPDPARPAESQETLRWRFPWPQPEQANVLVEHRVSEGEFGEEILRVARSTACDLIVIGTHGRTGLKRLLTGSVAEEVLRKADCPVLAVKTPAGYAGNVRPSTFTNPMEPAAIPPIEPAPLLTAQTRTLLLTQQMEVAQLMVPDTVSFAEKTTRGTVIFHCLEGAVLLSARDKSEVLRRGQLLYLPEGEPWTVKGIGDAAILMTTLLE